uniref:Uncharacterized protein n=1 Tax=Panagrolaimus davidi TaxID=227884 RepID=A0A914PUL9_9BILA
MAYFKMDYLCGDFYQFAFNSVNFTYPYLTGECGYKLNLECYDFEQVAECTAYKIGNEYGDYVRSLLKKVYLYQICSMRASCLQCVDLISGDRTVVHLSSGLCTDNDRKRIQSCYENEIFSAGMLPRNSKALSKTMSTAFANSEKFLNLCNAKASLDRCLTQKVIQNCITIRVFKTLNFDVGRLFLANYFHLDYMCKNQWAFRIGDCVRETFDFCDTEKPEECDEIGDYLKCIRNDMQIFECDTKAVKCYTLKFGAYQACYSLQNCQMCNSLSFARNDVNNLCNIDIGNNNISIFTTLNSIPTFPAIITSTQNPSIDFTNPPNGSNVNQKIYLSTLFVLFLFTFLV